MKINYQNYLKEIIKKIDKNNKPRLLLHVCCGPCSTTVLNMINDYFDITCYFYNPNIDRLDEYLKREGELKKVISHVDSSIKEIVVPYEHTTFLTLSKGLEEEKEGGKRCYFCIKERLKKTFEYAKSNNFSYVTTTLTISPYKNSEMINKIGEELEKEYHIKYLYSDFKKDDGYKKSIDYSKEYGLYRQDYCGCEYGKKEMKVKRVVVDYLEENCYILVKDNKALVIDPGGDFFKIKDALFNLEVEGILVTHYHHDHIGALKELEEYSKASVYDFSNLKEGINKIGSFTFELIRTPGHKEDAVCYYFKEDKVMFTGDFLFKGDCGRTDLVGGNPLDMRKSLIKIRKYSDDIIIYPGHDEKSTLGEEKKNNICWNQFEVSI